MIAWIKAEWEYLLWRIDFRKYCQQCDEIYNWPIQKHKTCHCPGFWRI
jgi:hypothetical protein